MKRPLLVGGLGVIPSDLMFLACSLLWAIASLLGEAKLKWNSGFWPLAIYFAALALSAAFSVDPKVSGFKLATQAYLMGIAVLTYQLVQTADDLRRLFLACIGGAAIVGIMGVATVTLFPFFGWHSFLAWPLHHFGTLPPGPYPRIELTFEYPAMMANYLALALMLVILARRLGWIGRRPSLLLGGAILVTAFFALTPGFGGLLFMLAIWVWHRNRGSRSGGAALIAAGGLAVLEVAVASVTPILHRTAPFLIHIPGLETPLAPAVRLLVWIDAGRNFLAHPILGRGIGIEAAAVPYASPEGNYGIVADAHNVFLSLASQSGIVGLLAMTLLIAFAVRQAMRGKDVAFGLGLAFLSGLVVQGLVGSFEDTRHLWLAYGLMLAAAKLEHQGKLEIQVS